MATLLVELSLTRIFSVVFYYHFAFLAISIALFGLGAGGVFSYAVAGWKGNLFSKLGHLSAINSVLVIVAVLVVLEQGRNPSAWYLALIYFTCALPFFVAGAVVSLAVSETIDRVNRVYFSTSRERRVAACCCSRCSIPWAAPTPRLWLRCYSRRRRRYGTA